MSDDALTAWLEQNGEIPKDATQAAELRVWNLAQRTSWWGKPIDAATFWQGRVKWLDDENDSAASRRGRYFPPIPPEAQGFSPPDDHRLMNQSSVDSPSVRYVVSSSESAFWDQFSKTHPHPPERIQQEQERLSEKLLVARHRFLNEGNPNMTTEERLAEMNERGKSVAGNLGYPSESLGDEALFWAYVMTKRQQYDREYKPFLNMPLTSWHASNWLSRLAVDPKFITEPLTPAQLTAANAWKFAYLQRLRRENTDESYINAYLEAWNLTEAEVFSAK